VVAFERIENKGYSLPPPGNYRTLFFADFACHECGLVIEVDGGGHAEHEQIVADNARTQFLESQGYRVLRFWNNDVLKDTETVMIVSNDALTALRPQQPPTLTPPRHARRARGGRGTHNGKV
jgi:hypothetical protein